MSKYCLVLLLVCSSAIADVTHPGSSNIHAGNQWHTNSIGYKVGNIEPYAATSQGTETNSGVDIGKQAEVGINYYIASNLVLYAALNNSFGADMSSGKTYIYHYNPHNPKDFIAVHAESAGDVARYYGNVPSDGFFIGIKGNW